MRPITTTLVVSLGFALAACQTPLSPASRASALGGGATGAEAGVEIRTAGGGHYTIPGGIDLEIAFSALQLPNGRAEGNFHHRGVAEGLLIDFTGQVTCLAVDSVNHRAWIGGVITQNRSTHPQFTTTVHQVGHDIWFRVQDNGPGGVEAPPDVTTIVGFEGVIPSSEAYCTTRPWRSENVWPLVGNLTVSP